MYIYYMAEHYVADGESAWQKASVRILHGRKLAHGEILHDINQLMDIYCTVLHGRKPDDLPHGRYTLANLWLVRKPKLEICRDGIGVFGEHSVSC